MPVFNYPKKEVNVKVVYYGPGLSGKTTNLQKIHDGIKPEFRGKLVSLATQTDRTLFFDFMPMDLGSLGGYKVRLHLYTVPGQVHYNATRKLVLKGVDGIVFVADSQMAMNDANVESVLNLEKNLQSYGKSLDEIPHVIQANKRDLDDVITMEEITSLLNLHGAIVTEASASEGKGVMETLTEIVRLVMRGLRDQFTAGLQMTPAPPRGQAAPQPDGEPEPAPVSLSTTAPPAEPDDGETDEDIEPQVEEEDSSFVDGGDEMVVEQEESGADEPQVQPGSDPGSGSIPTESIPASEDGAGSPVDLSGSASAPGSTVKILVAVKDIGTLELSLNISARILEDGAVKAVEVHGLGDAPAGPLKQASPPLPQADTGGGTQERFPEDRPEQVTIRAGSPAGSARDSGSSVTRDAPAKPSSEDEELPPLSEISEEPLGVPLDGQEVDDLYIPELQQEEKKILDEDPAVAPHKPSSTGPASGYDPTVQPLDFDFPETESENEEPRKKGLLGRFKKK